MKIAEKAALHRSQKDIEKMKAFLKKRWAAASAGDTEASILADIQFHLSIAAASRNDVLADLYKTFADHLTRHFRHLYHNTEAFIRTQGWHESLLKSIVDQDPEKAWHWSSKIVAH
jgi:DNA-binding FadR family transcriptional regulator